MRSRYKISPDAVPFTENVLPALLDWRRAGKASALVTLVNVDGSSPRRTGSQMAVNAQGEYTGYISSGCAEAAIVAEAIAAIKAGVSRTVRYGAGSRYIDVVLPCGSGIDVHFDPAIETSKLDWLQEQIEARQPAHLMVAGIVKHYEPAPRIVIAGRGVNVDYVARFARDLEWDIVVASPDETTLSRLGWIGARQLLSKPADFDVSVIDRRTAVVLLFHDHEWEPAILAKCASSDAFYTGALGSRKTHGERKKMLAARGCEPAFVDRIKSPVGLDIGAKNPAEIAIAIIAEIMMAVPKA
jgi:xanthine dehydrogenase accessory factor